MAKSSQRFDYARLAEALHERGMVEPGPLNELLVSSRGGGPSFTEGLVSAGLVSDWDLSRTVCEVFNIPFLPVEFTQPDEESLALVDAGFLAQHGLVPLGHFDHVLTVLMPGLVTADVLGMLSAATDMVVLPIVGTVNGNRRWLSERLNISANAPDGQEFTVEGAWGSLFDEGDAAVLDALDGGVEVDESGAVNVDADLSAALEILAPDEEGALEDSPPIAPEPGEHEEGLEGDGSPEEDEEDKGRSFDIVPADSSSEGDGPPTELPPAPDFG